MIDEELAAFAADGRALIVGAVDPGGAPHSTRGWGFCLDADGVPVVLLDADDGRGLDALAPGRPIAVTAADVRDLRSIQFKGSVQRVEEASTTDVGRVEAYVRAFRRAIVETDGIPPESVDRLTPTRFVRCRFACADIFDQTPGPGAGDRVDRAS